MTIAQFVKNNLRKWYNVSLFLLYLFMKNSIVTNFDKLMMKAIALDLKLYIANFN